MVRDRDTFNVYRGDSESEEDSESYARVNPGSSKKAYYGNPSLTSSTGPNSNNDVRIKIRKNSIEPHMAVKANHKQIVK